MIGIKGKVPHVWTQTNEGMNAEANLQHRMRSPSSGRVSGVPGEYSLEDPSTVQWKESISIWSEEGPAVDQLMFESAIKRSRSWKADGHNGICAYWWKVFPRVAHFLHEIITGMVDGNIPIPGWFVRGRTVLVPKQGCKGRVDQYRPITCLNTSYKLFTTVLTTILQQHLEENNIMPVEQKALRKGRRGCLDALMLDSMIIREAAVRGKNLSVAWIDYQKAYDHVPHSWLEQMLEYISVPGKVRHCLSALIPLWKTQFSIKSGRDTVHAELSLKRGLFQGDSLSPLLFCLCIVPLSHALRTADMGYRCKHLAEGITHQLYLDDLKVYTRGREKLETIHATGRQGVRCSGDEAGSEEMCGGPYGWKPVDTQ